jgi:basic amino acid/polyamine antiporter, APA family
VTVAFVDLRGAIGFSSFGVLIYYFIANAAAWRQSADARLYPRVLQVLGGIGCAVLVVTLPVVAVAAGAVVVAAGILYRFVRLRVLRARPS